MDTINLITNLYNEYKMFGISEKCFYETVREVTSNQDKENVLIFTREFEEKIREKLNKRIEKTYKKESSCDSYSLYLKDINVPILNEDEERDLFIRFKNGEINAKNILIERNLKLVVSIVKKYKSERIDRLDLIQEGNLGLITAIERYDISLGYKFSTYATCWIKKYIRDFIKTKAENIQTTNYISSKVKKIRSKEEELGHKLGRLPFLEEVADACYMTKEEVERFIKYKPVEISIYNEISDKSDDMIIDKIEDTSDSIEDVVAKRYLKSNLINMLKRAKLDDREIEVLILRFGLCGCESQSCEKLSKLYGLTKQRLNQIELTALKKVRLSGVAMELIEFAEDYEEAKNKIKEYRDWYLKHPCSYKK